METHSFAIVYLSLKLIFLELTVMSKSHSFINLMPEDLVEERLEREGVL